MGLSDILSKITDPYERKARLSPALLVLLPIIATWALLYGPESSLVTNTVSIAVSCGLLYLLSNISRESGKRIEPELYRQWGGTPTTQLLRHRDTTIEGPTKRRYHLFLSEKIREPFPDPDEEVLRPQHADDLYQSAIRWLLNQTRDKDRFKLLFLDNITYGFRRNTLGLKPIGIAVCLASIVWVIFSAGIIAPLGEQVLVQRALRALPGNAIAALVLSIGMLLTWIFFFTKENVKSAAFSYAEKLLRACDVLEKG